MSQYMSHSTALRYCGRASQHDLRQRLFAAEGAELLPFDQIRGALEPHIREAALIAIDGLPCSGKTALADRLAVDLGLQILGLDDFYLPEAMWPRDIAPAFPFPFFRADQFREALHDLKTKGRCSYLPYDIETGRLSATPRELRRRGPLIVEGCSVLDPSVERDYDLRLFVASDRATVLEARRHVGGGAAEAAHWERLFLPSVDLYMATEPERRADIVVQGRGLR